MYPNIRSIWKNIKGYLYPSEKMDPTTTPSEGVPRLKLSTVKSIVLRSSSKKRVIAPDHRRAFDYPGFMDPFRQRMFNWTLEQPGTMEEWRKAQAWWQDLYGEYIDENDDCNRTEDDVNDTPVNIEDWIKKNAPSPEQHTHNKHRQNVYRFIRHWSSKINQLTSRNIEKHNAEIKKLLLKVHPDRNGCSEACKTLIEWKKITSHLFTKADEEQEQTTDWLAQYTCKRARPWHVWSLYVDYQTELCIQQEKDSLHQINQEIIESKKNILKNNRKILSQKKTIQLMKAELRSRNHNPS